MEKLSLLKIALKYQYMNLLVATFCVWIMGSLSIEMRLLVFQVSFIN